MPAYLPITNADALAVLNLPDKARITALFEKHKSGVLSRLALVSDSDVWEEMISADGSPTNEEKAAYLLAYSYTLLSRTALLLNLRTVGEGIVRSAGFQDSRESLLDIKSTEEMSNKLDELSLIAIEAYLNSYGLRELDRYRYKTQTRMSVKVIKSTEDTSVYLV